MASDLPVSDDLMHNLRIPSQEYEIVNRSIIKTAEDSKPNCESGKRGSHKVEDRRRRNEDLRVMLNVG